MKRAQREEPHDPSIRERLQELEKEQKNIDISLNQEYEREYNRWENEDKIRQEKSIRMDQDKSS
jgi:hypothetical protein